MHFEPRIISDDGEDFDLPDDLLILAEQLTADADRLATVYPVDRQVRSPEVAADVASIAAGAVPRVSPKFNWRRIAGAAAVLFAVGVGGWAAFGLRDVGQQPENIAALRTNSNVAEQNNATKVTTVSSRVADSVPAMSSVLFQDLTGPEQEAVLDLLEGDGSQPASLSI